MTGIVCIPGDGHLDEDDAAYARRLQEEADREHYARLIDGHGTLEAALQGGVLLAHTFCMRRSGRIMFSAASSLALLISTDTLICFKDALTLSVIQCSGHRRGAGIR